MPQVLVAGLVHWVLATWPTVPPQSVLQLFPQAPQLLGVVMARYILHHEPLASMPVDELVAEISPTIQRYLTQPLARRSATAPNG